MNRYLNNFRFNYDEVVLGDLEILEPTVVRSKVTGSYYTLAGEPAKRLFSGIHMRSKNFSNTLYQVDIPTWRNLIEKKLTNADVKNFLFSNKAVVMDSHIVSIVEGSPALPSLIDALNKFATDDIDCHYTFDALNQLVFLAIDKETKVQNKTRVDNSKNKERKEKRNKTTTRKRKEKTNNQTTNYPSTGGTSERSERAYLCVRMRVRVILYTRVCVRTRMCVRVYVCVRVVVYYILYIIFIIYIIY